MVDARPLGSKVGEPGEFRFNDDDGLVLPPPDDSAAAGLRESPRAPTFVLEGPTGLERERD
jgi:hypothetical protein